MSHFTQAGNAPGRIGRVLSGCLLALGLYSAPATAQTPCPLPTFPNTFPTTISANSSANNCGIAVTYVAASSSSSDALKFNLTGATVDSGIGTGSTHVFRRGITHIVVTATNSCGSASKAFDLTVADGIAPQISATPNITVNSSPTTCGAVVTYATPTATDNCIDCNETFMASLGYTKLGELNQHTYFSIPGTMSWLTADSIASSFGGYLVSIGSAAEDQYVASMIGTAPTWMGFTDWDEEMNWKWTSGEAVTYTNWCTDQPDDWLTGQDYGLMNSLGIFVSNNCWDDVHSPTRTGTDIHNNFSAIFEINSCASALQRTAGLASGSMFPVGTTVVTYKATDASGNTTTQSFNVTVIDNTKPTLTCPQDFTLAANSTNTSPTVTGQATATDNCGTPTVTYTDAVSGNVTTRTWKATDVNGNVSDCVQKITIPTATVACNITVTPANNTYTGGIATNIYIGYGPQTATLTATSPCTGTVTYSWSGTAAGKLSCTNCQSPVFTPGVAGNYTATVTATNAAGCSSTCAVTFCVKDIRVPANCCNKGKSKNKDCDDEDEGNKVYVCHRPPGNPTNTQILCLPVSAIPAHIGPNGHANDFLGKCDQLCGTSARMVQGQGSVIGTQVKVYPNPATNTFYLELPFFEIEASVTLMDMQGKVLQARRIKEEDDHTLRFDFGENNPRGLYMVDVKYDDHRYRTKVVLQ